MKSYYLIFTLLIFVYSCKSDYTEDENANYAYDLNLEVKTIFNDSIGWGYQIYQNGDIYINQPHIPTIQGYKGFENEKSARKIGEYVMNKIENNIIPPTITHEELDSILNSINLF